MFFKLRRFYNQNRLKVWKYIAIIVFIIMVASVLKKAFTNSQDGRSTEDTSVISAQTNNVQIITGEKVEESKAEKYNNVIDSFFECCNNGKYEDAYELISKDCKEEMFNSLDEFKTDYFDKLFKTKKTYTTQAWVDNTYLINIYNDAFYTRKCGR